MKTRCSAGFWLAANTSARATAAMSAGAGAGQALQLVLEAAARAEADDRREIVGEDVGLPDRLQLAREPADQGVRRQRRVGPLREGLQRNDEEGGVRFGQPVEHAEADDRGDAGDALGLGDDILDVLRATTSVRLTEAPSGSWISPKIAP